ncbi:MucR family transcriptional regulator [Methylobacterium sp. E-025]|uniref:MucR family transcriptional regulator n=1 Tax=Methylobacterium sp. E-025 TaxID=2836561 RepID=UPI001FBAAE6F|nr:MucR family transcriptional regulator [Methylobacterium sp. E-025]MCJ2113240.1 MucR family transcriptional regulator [Methylobacterium sp. E-025]
MEDTKHMPAGSSIELMADLVAAYVSNNTVPVSELPNVIASVHAALSRLGNETAVEPTGSEKATAAQMRKSITPDALISFIDGKRYKTLKRHLAGRGLTMEAYRARYGLPSDYPSNSASYSAQRSELARSLGLGQQRRKAAPKGADTGETISEAPETRGRKSKAVESSEATLEGSWP